MADATISAGGADTGPVTNTRRIMIMTALILASLMASLDSSFAPLAFPDMIDDLDTSTSMVVWVALGYLIAATGPMLFMSRVADAYGRVRMFQIGATIYSLAMIACSFAPDINTLILLRAVQGFGMALFLPTTFSLGAESYPPESRGRALGLLASANALGFVLGPVFAGWLLDAFDWRAIFWARIPLAALTIVLALVVFNGAIGTLRKKISYFDSLGAVFLTLGLFGLLFGFNRLPVEDNHLDPLVWLIFASGFVFSWAFLWQEKRCANPLVDLNLFRERPEFAKAALAFTAIFASFPVYLFVLPIVLISGLEIPAWDVGMIMAVVALSTTLISPYAGRLSDRFGADWLCTAGALVTAAGYLMLLLLPLSGVSIPLIVSMVLIGLGTGLFFSPNNNLIMSNVPPERIDMASGLIGTLRQTGYAVGFAIVASLFTAVQDAVELNWVNFSLSQIMSSEASETATFFDNGAQWSPEVLMFILHLSVALCAALLIITVVNSYPKIIPGIRVHLATFGAAVAVAVLGIFALAQMSDMTPTSAAVASSDGTRADLVTPFGMSERGTIEVAEYEDVGLSPAEAFVGFCSDCHGLYARGTEEVPINLIGNEFIADISDEDLRTFIIEGIRPGDQQVSEMHDLDFLEDEEYAGLISYLRDIQSKVP